MTPDVWERTTDVGAMLRLATGRVSLCCGCVWCDNGDGTVSLAGGQRCCPKCDNATPVEGYREIGSGRKLRLFAVACCRQVWDRLSDERLRPAVEVAERYADGGVNEAARAAAQQKVWSIPHGAGNVLVADVVLRLPPGDRPNPWDRLLEDCGMSATQAAILRDLIGSPHRPYVLPAHLRTPLVVSLAEMAYECREGRKCGRCHGHKSASVVDVEAHERNERQHKHVFVPPRKRINCPDCQGSGTINHGTLDNDRLAILCDALCEAGLAEDGACGRCGGTGRHTPDDGWGARDRCPDCAGAGRVPSLLLAGLRSQGAKYRGYWALDAILGKG